MTEEPSSPEDILRSPSDREILDDIICSLDDIIFSIDTSGTFIYISKAVSIHFGIGPEHILGRKVRDIAEGLGVDMDEFDSLQEQQKRAREEGKSRRKVVFSIPKGTRKKYFEMLETDRFSPKGARLNTIGTIRDITERRDAEEKIRAIKEMFELLGADASRNTDIIVAAASDLLGAVCSMYNRLDDERQNLIVWSGKNLPDDMEPRDAPVGHICYEATIKGGDETVVLGELRGTKYETSDPNVVRYGLRSYLGHPVRLDGVAIGALCIVDVEPREFTQMEIQSISTLAGALSQEEERKQALQNLEKSEQRFRLLFEEVPIAIQGYNSERDVIFWNRASEAVYGYSSSEALGCKLEELIIPEQMRKSVKEGIRNWIEKGEPIPAGEIGLQRKDGSIVPVYSSHALLRDQDDSPELFCMDLDLRPLRQAESERQLLERKMLHTQKLESLGVLAGGIAHDFNNLLAAILGNAELALRKIEEDSPVQSNLETIEKTALRSADLCLQMLAYSGMGDFIKEKVSLAALAEDILHLLEVMISKEVRLLHDLCRDTPPVYADSAQVRQVIMNLVTNASEAIGKGGGAVTISTGAMRCSREYFEECYLRDDLQEGTYSYIAVRDNGSGISPENRDRLFDPFFTTKFTGRGLGLSAVLGIVRGHGGTINITSEPGIGTEMVVLFPSIVGSIGTGRQQRIKADTDWTGTGRILLVDDEDFVRDVGSQMLESLGFSVLTARDGEEALDVFEQSASDLVAVLLDLTMPKMNGIKCHELMRMHNDKVPVILCSGFSREQIQREYQARGPESFLQKPFKREQLQEILRKVIEEV